VDHLACVDLPVLPLQLLLRQHPDWRQQPAAVVDRDKAQGTLLWVNEVARQRRILPGMRYATALSLTSELRAGTIEHEEIKNARQQILSRLQRFSAGVEPSGDEPGVFWLDASGLALLYPSLTIWGQRIREKLREQQLHATVAVGFSRFGTYALARATRGVMVCAHEDIEGMRAREVPLDRLDLNPKTRDTLDKLGVRTVGAFIDLPAPGIRRRFGEEAAQLHALAAGETFAPLQPVIAAEPLVMNHTLDNPESDRDRLLALIGQDLATLLPQMRERREVMRALELELRFDGAPPRNDRLQPAAPTEKGERLLELVRLRLEGQPLPEGVTGLTLQLETVKPRQAQTELFMGDARRDLAAASRGLARVRAELGDASVQWAELVEAHLPEARVRWHTHRDRPEFPVAHPRPVHEPPLVRRVFDRPRPLSRQRRNDPEGWMILGLTGGAVQDVRGPWTTSGGWWVREVLREYHYVCTEREGWLWVYFDRRRRRWFLQGTVE
jgi:protein ImuB